MLRLPAAMLTAPPGDMAAAYAAWMEALPLSEPATHPKRDRQKGEAAVSEPAPATLTAIMQRILAWPIESRSPMDSMAFLAEIKQQLAHIF